MAWRGRICLFLLGLALACTSGVGESAQSDPGTFELARESLARRDLAEAVRQYRAAADGGDAAAQFSLGVLTALGQGTARDTAAAIVLYRRSAEQGDARAQYTLGDKYSEGAPARSAGSREIEIWLDRLARLGDATNPLAAGSEYHFGLDGLAADPAEAYYWFSKAAEQDHLMAWRRLGELYARGRGTTQDKVRAHMWFQLCAERGIADAEGWRDHLAARMSPEELAESDRLARERR